MNPEIYRQLNKQNDFTLMKPLAEITSEEKKEKMEEEGYFAGYTVDSWKKEFPAIDPKYILVPKSALYPASLVYYDEKHYICFDTQIYNGQVLDIGGPNSNPARHQDRLLKMVEEQMEHLREKDYLRLLRPMTSEESGGTAMHLLRLMLENEKPCPELYDAFLNVYTLCNTGAHVLGPDAIKRLIACKSKEQRERTAAALSSFPGDVLEVYRGEGSESTFFETACSWTMDIRKAYFFASWRGSDGASVLTGKVGKNSIIEYVDDRSESEVIVLPGAVTDVSRSLCYDMEEFREYINPARFDASHKLPLNSNPDRIMKGLREIYSDIDVEDHTMEHSFRVTVMASFLYRIHVLSPLTSGPIYRYDAATKVYRKLIEAAEYHDAGRTDNEINATHGAAGYQKYLEKHRSDDIVEFLTTYHCREDEVAREYWKRNFAGENAEYVWEAFLAIRDADALDRVRFGSLSRDYVDVRRLRLEEAKRLMPVAHALAEMRFG